MNSGARVRFLSIVPLFSFYYLLICIKLFNLQIHKQALFVSLAKKQHEPIITDYWQRGTIFDCNGIPLTANDYTFSTFVRPKDLKERATIELFLQKHYPGAYQRYLTQPESPFMFIKRRINNEEILKIRAERIDELQLLKEPSRRYHFKELAEIVGVTNIDNNGISGIEYMFNEQLKGGSQSYRIQKYTRHETLNSSQPQPRASKNITLTVDANLQFLVYQELKKRVTLFKAKQGSIIVMDPASGDIKAMANYFAGDANKEQSSYTHEKKNFCIAEQYELGSVIKIFAALAALEEKVCTPEEIIDCGSTKEFFLDGRKIRTPVAHGELSFSQIIEKSNNIGIAIIAKRLGKKLYEHYVRVGFAQATGIELPGEQKGWITPPEKWSQQSVISLSYGYEIAITLLQLARAFSIIAHDGCMVQPRIVKDQFAKPIISEPLYRRETIDQITKILQLTTLQGTARKAQMNGYDVMCKTGTANLLENGKYVTNKNSYTCAGILKKDAYCRVIIVYLRETPTSGLFASQVSAPLFEKIAQKIIIHDKVI